MKHFHRDTEAEGECHCTAESLRVSADCIGDVIVSEEPCAASIVLDADDLEQSSPETEERIRNFVCSPNMIREVNGKHAGEKVDRVGPCLQHEDLDGGAAKEDRQRD
jgi:hypothetical protein